MITKEKARKTLESEGENFSNEELEKILEYLRIEAKIVIKEFKDKSEKSKIKDGDEKKL